jgi:hypothetical protein
MVWPLRIVTIDAYDGAGEAGGMGSSPPPYSDLLSPGHHDSRRLLSPGAR